MTISTTELGELLTALGGILRGEARPAVETKEEPQIVAGTFEAPVEAPSVVTPAPADLPQIPVEDSAAKRIAELEAELMKVKGQSAVLGLQPIKLATNNNTEVLHG